MWFKDHRKNAYCRVHGLLPLCVMTAILPFLWPNALIELPIIAFSAGVMMKTFTSSQIENHPFVNFYDFRKLSKDADGTLLCYSGVARIRKNIVARRSIMALS